MKYQNLLYRNSDGEMNDDEVVIGKQILLQLYDYISMCPTLQLSHNDVPDVGLGGCWNQVVPSHSPISNYALAKIEEEWHKLKLILLTDLDINLSVY